MGWNMAMAMECYQRGIIGTEDTKGLNLQWGDARVVAEMIQKTAKREGFGNILAESIPGMIEKIGPDSKPYGLHVKGMSFTYPTGEMPTMGLASITAARGADHLKAHPYAALTGISDMFERAFGKDMPEELSIPSSTVAKGRAVWWHENLKMLIDALGICFVPTASTNLAGGPYIMFEEIGEIYQAVTGEEPRRLFESTERANQIEKSFNALLGLSRKDDKRQGIQRVPKDPMNEPGMLDEYYDYRGFSREGIPTRKRLLELGLTDVVEDLEKKGALSDHECPAIEEQIA